ncbi:hypothetical protein T265_09043 [Opisthorchis viverrini]|uniref:Uncharacterized protein n=1 Tax=Opisthorchis viverrini TaxID=6198 RepID=A0A074ZI27_OPIVI|nr:hypothetical protein T265_09043 [Opisthorchis viverrini]KER22955.1 hypothetical protein T265_09043 [Opisthorchis viverrini]
METSSLARPPGLIQLPSSLFSSMFRDLEALDFASLLPKKGWTKKRFLELFDETCQLILFQLKQKWKEKDIKIESLRARSAQIAALPPSYDKMSYFDFINGHEVVMNDASEAKKRSRMEWEESVRTRTGKRPRAVALNASTRTTNRLALDEEPIMTALPSIQQGRSPVQTTTQTTTTKRATRNQRLERTPAVSSTPINPEVNGFVVPSAARTTRSRRVGGTRLPRRPIKPQDTLTSIRGSPVMNPFQLGSSSDKQRPNQDEIQLLRQMLLQLKNYLGSQ